MTLTMLGAGQAMPAVIAALHAAGPSVATDGHDASADFAAVLGDAAAHPGPATERPEAEVSAGPPPFPLPSPEMRGRIRDGDQAPPMPAAPEDQTGWPPPAGTQPTANIDPPGVPPPASLPAHPAGPELRAAGRDPDAPHAVDGPLRAALPHPTQTGTAGQGGTTAPAPRQTDPIQLPDYLVTSPAPGPSTPRRQPAGEGIDAIIPPAQAAAGKTPDPLPRPAAHEPVSRRQVQVGVVLTTNPTFIPDVVQAPVSAIDIGTAEDLPGAEGRMEIDVTAARDGRPPGVKDVEPLATPLSARPDQFHRSPNGEAATPAPVRQRIGSMAETTFALQLGTDADTGGKAGAQVSASVPPAASQPALTPSIHVAKPAAGAVQVPLWSDPRLDGAQPPPTAILPQPGAGSPLARTDTPVTEQQAAIGQAAPPTFGTALPAPSLRLPAQSPITTATSWTAPTAPGSGSGSGSVPDAPLRIAAQPAPAMTPTNPEAGDAAHVHTGPFSALGMTGHARAPYQVAPTAADAGPASPAATHPPAQLHAGNGAGPAPLPMAAQQTSASPAPEQAATDPAVPHPTPGPSQVAAHPPLAVPTPVPVPLSALPATLITAWQDAGPGRIEIALAPEELGRMTIAVTGEGDGLRIAITADRPETLDLLRRHADQLLADLRQGGMGGALLSFGGGGQGRSREGQGAESPTAPAQPAPIRLVAHPPPPHGHAALNLRL